MPILFPVTPYTLRRGVGAFWSLSANKALLLVYQEQGFGRHLFARGERFDSR